MTLRHRLPLTVIALAFLARLVVPGAVHAIRDTAPVLTLTQPVAAGTIITQARLAIVRVPRGLVPPGALTDPMEALERRTLTDLPAHFPLASELLAEPGALARTPPGTVAAPVRLSDPAAAAVLSPGTRVDLLASPGTTHDGEIIPATRLASGALVLDVPEAPPGQAGQAGLVLFALTPAEAALISGATSFAALTAVIVG